MAIRLLASGAGSMSTSLRMSMARGLTIGLKQGQRFGEVFAFEWFAEARPPGGRLVGEPRVLALGVATGRLLACCYRFLERRLAGEVGGNLPHTDPAHDRQVRVEMARE